MYSSNSESWPSRLRCRAFVVTHVQLWELLIAAAVGLRVAADVGSLVAWWLCQGAEMCSFCVQISLKQCKIHGLPRCASWRGSRDVVPVDTLAHG